MNSRRMTHEPTPDEVADAEDLIAIEAAEFFEAKQPTKRRRLRDPAPSSLREDCMNVKGEHDV